ncbi:hypothetical protein JCGZ_18245 [Jatropha curcas]|uniref:Uncharacterized protein n=1 Tax=Jatropha curcas TaxID=180498 RepID=A0A067KBY0_JATCU|nr:uncharacterized protein LOC105641938 [Jatropha curcas]KDP29324.1 hypothetical protein JCGZ_18245 [Jatropha curcas]
MKERGKAVEIYNNNSNSDMYFQDYSTSSSDLPCKKHPSSSSVGICAYCLKDRLMNLVCSDCGEQRLSSCSCSEISSNRNSCTVDVGSVGRISFLIENDQRNNEISNSKPKIGEKTEEVNFLLKRSSSSCVEIKRKSGFWRIGKLFSKKREKGSYERNSISGFEERSDSLWVVDYMGVSRSRSLCSFRGGGGGFFGSEDGTFSGARSSISGARSSISAARNSGVNNGLIFDPERKSGFSSETEPRKSGFDSVLLDSDQKLDFSGFNGANTNTRRVFSLKEGNFTTMEDSGFIDLKFDGLSDSNSAFGSMKGNSDFVAVQEQCGGSFGSFVGDGMFSNGGSCRITVSDRGIKRSRKSFKSWRWIFRQNNSDARKKHEEYVVKPLA